MNRGCVVHYPNQNDYSTLKKVSDINREKITAANHPGWKFAS